VVAESLKESDQSNVKIKDSVVSELEKIQKAVDKIYGNSEKFEEEGTLIFDEDGNAVFLMKKDKNKLAKIFELEQEVKKNVNKDNKIII